MKTTNPHLDPAYKKSLAKSSCLLSPHIAFFEQLVSKKNITLLPHQKKIAKELLRWPRGSGKTFLINLLWESDVSRRSAEKKLL